MITLHGRHGRLLRFDGTGECFLHAQEMRIELCAGTWSAQTDGTAHVPCHSGSNAVFHFIPACDVAVRVDASNAFEIQPAPRTRRVHLTVHVTVGTTLMSEPFVVRPWMQLLAPAASSTSTVRTRLLTLTMRRQRAALALCADEDDAEVLALCADNMPALAQYDAPAVPGAPTDGVFRRRVVRHDACTYVVTFTGNRLLLCVTLQADRAITCDKKGVRETTGIVLPGVSGPPGTRVRLSLADGTFWYVCLV